MKKYRKQHVISETYLKHFSINSDGKNLFVIDGEDQYHRGIQMKNSGDSIFWEENYSDSYFFQDRKAIEKMFGNEIEPRYNKIIRTIETEDMHLSFDIKEDILKWIFYTKMRSPIWEYQSENSKNQPISKNRYSQQLHLENFTNEKRFVSALNNFITDALNKRWTIYKSPVEKYWWTSDNSGYCIDLESLESNKSLNPDPFCNLNGVDAILFYPLSKNYCLSIHPYDIGDEVNLNLTNTPLTFQIAEFPLFKIINYCTLITQRRLIISTDNESLRIVEQLKTDR